MDSSRAEEINKYDKTSAGLLCNERKTGNVKGKLKTRQFFGVRSYNDLVALNR